VLVASIRSAEVMAELAAAGCDTFTISPEVQHPSSPTPDAVGSVSL